MKTQNDSPAMDFLEEGIQSPLRLARDKLRKLRDGFFGLVIIFVKVS